MSICIDYRSKIVIIVPPKNGCSTVRLTVGEFLFSENIPRITHNYHYDRKLSEKFELYRNREELKDYDYYFIYREPMERFQSYVTNVIDQRLSNPKRWSNDQQWQNFLVFYYDQTGEGLTAPVSLDTLLDTINAVKPRFGQEPMDTHAIPQSVFLKQAMLAIKYFNTAKLRIVKLSELRHLLAKYYPRYIGSNIQTIKSKQLELTNTTVEKIRQVYEEDYELTNKYHVYQPEPNVIPEITSILSVFLSQEEITEFDIVFGINNYRDLIENFDMTTYRKYSPDLKAMTNYEIFTHFIRCGHREKRLWRKQN